MRPNIKFIVASSVLLIGLLISPFTAVAADNIARVIDPVFGLSYDPSKIDFQKVDSDVFARCPELTNAKWDRRSWIFAEYRQADERYLAIGGYFVPRSPAKKKPAFETDPNGVLLQLDGAGCKLMGAVREEFDYDTEPARAPILRALAKDAVERFDAAFGGRRALAKVFRDQKINLDDPRSSILRDALRQGGK